ncbi:MAG: hypothetical protein A2029_12240 [Chloroflexi bacterium RBG_19FT_COMBO_47_9]|nr:MAG: hypothetical protein A2029_12240 [Chloroflexi bacterium RBG_19FT_COMBO_47_9]
MIPELMILGAVFLVSLTSIFILVSQDWRYCIVALAIQYFGVFLLLYSSLPVETAIVKIVAGWMAGAILGIAVYSGPGIWRKPDYSLKFGPVFRIMAAAMIALAITSLVFSSESWLLMISTPIRWGSFILIGIGLLQLSLSSNPLRVIIGLLTALSGFEILYAVIESSILVMGLLAGVNLGLALVGAYLLIAPTMEGS